MQWELDRACPPAGAWAFFGTCPGGPTVAIAELERLYGPRLVAAASGKTGRVAFRCLVPAVSLCLLAEALVCCSAPLPRSVDAPPRAAAAPGASVSALPVAVVDPR